MEKQRKVMIAILTMLVLIAVIAVIDVSLRIDKTAGPEVKLKMPQFGPGIAVVRIDGPIEMSGTSGFTGVPKGAESVIKRLDELEKNSNIKGIVVRINSPGGTVAATQEIYEKLWKLRKKNIILVASMGDVAASGGYYIASACNHIIANYGTVTGSIGVIAYSPNLKKLFDKLGIGINVIKSGKYKDTLASHRDMAPEERRLLQEMIDLSYDKFIKDIARGRSMSESEIIPVADGRIMNGETALKHGLIDQTGTFEDAISKAKGLAGLKEDAPVYEETFSPFDSFLGILGNYFSGGSFPLDKILSPEKAVEYRYQQ